MIHMQKCKELCGRYYGYSDGLLIDCTNVHKVCLWSPCLKTSPFCLVPCARDALWYTKHSDIDVIDNGCL